jgi:hypothetical protein
LPPPGPSRQRGLSKGPEIPVCGSDCRSNNGKSRTFAQVTAARRSGFVLTCSSSEPVGRPSRLPAVGIRLPLTGDP